ncbi:hypothetical protein TNCT_248301 [Trichonephila clavata]|uniref:Uncharacterized protein n=1 Tax=Trichonephila clavata TaxID=2740835 RepID=A0A8X6LWY7_TRICU|nr:hypothetical protein TNCT_248301 [Trichonephila clavata]
MFTRRRVPAWEKSENVRFPDKQNEKAAQAPTLFTRRESGIVLNHAPQSARDVETKQGSLFLGKPHDPRWREMFEKRVPFGVIRRSMA